MVVAGAPTGLAPLIGRESELAMVLAALREPGLATLSGPGGTGKTRLAIAVAEQLAGEMPTTFVDLSGVESPADVPGAVAAALGADDGGGADLVAAIAATLPGDAMVVVDNFEQVLPAGRFVAALGVAAPRLRVLATSRVALGLPAERVIPLSTLGVPATAAAVESSEAGRLFLERSRERGGRQALDAAETDAIVGICHRLDGLPLALELAAAWTSVLIPRAIFRRLDEGRLQLGPGAAGRHESLERVVEETLGLVDPPDRAVFEQLAVFVDGFDEPGAAAVTELADVLPNLRRLEAAALIRALADRDGEPRFAMLETIRAVGAKRLAARPDRDAIRRRFVATEAARAQAAADTLRDVAEQHAALTWMAAESSNLRSAYRSAVEHEHPAEAVQLAMTLATYGVRAGNPRECLARLREALLLGPVPPGIRSEALCAVVNLSVILDEPGDLVGMAREAVELAQVAREPRREARARVALGSYGPRSEAVAILQGAADFADRIEYAWAANAANVNLATTLLDAGRPKDALVVFRRELRAAQERHDEEGTAYVLGSIADILADAGDIDAALDYGARAAAVSRRFWPSSAALTSALSILAGCQAVAGRQSEAYATILEACEIARQAESDTTVFDVLAASIPVLATTDPPLAARAAARANAFVESARAGFALPGVSRRSSDAIRRRMGPARWTRLLQAARDEPLQPLVETIRRAAEAGLRTASRVQAAFGRLTGREAEVLPLLARGLTDPEIAEHLGITSKTASVHVANIKAKLGAETRIDAAIRAREILAAPVHRSTG